MEGGHHFSAGAMPAAIEDIDLGAVAPVTPEQLPENMPEVLVSSGAIAEPAVDPPLVPLSHQEVAEECRPVPPLPATAAMAGTAARLDEAGGLAGSAVVGVRVTFCMVRFSLGIPVDLEALGRALPNSELAFNSTADTTENDNVADAAPPDHGAPRCTKAGSSRTHDRRFLRVRAMKPPMHTVTVSRDGSVAVYASFEGDSVRNIAKRFARVVYQLYSASVTFRHYRVVNVMVTAHLGFEVDVEGFAATVKAGAYKHMCPVHIVQSGPQKVLARISAEEHTEATGKGNMVSIARSGVLSVKSSKSSDEAVALMLAVAPVLKPHRTWW